GDLPSSFGADVQVLDNDDAGFSQTGGWTNYIFDGYAGDRHYIAPGSGSQVATWTASVTPGRYRVSTTWRSWAGNATNAPFSISDGTGVVGMATVNEEAAPDDFLQAGVTWEVLGVFSITGSSLVVKASDNGNGTLTADAVRIERVSDVLPANTTSWF